MDKFFEQDHPFQTVVENAKKEQGEFIAKDPKHEGKICEYVDEWLDRLESKNMSFSTLL